MKIDILAIGVHPDDVELSCSGTIAKHISFSSLLSNLNFYFGRIISKSFLGKKMYSLTSSKYPLGYCLVAQK